MKKKRSRNTKRGLRALTRSFENSLLIAALFFGGLALMSCGHNEASVTPPAPAAPLKPSSQPTPVPTPIATPNPQPAGQADFVLKEKYIGKILSMDYPSDANAGELRLQGEEALALFNVMAVKEETIAGNKVWADARVKKGYHLYCITQRTKSRPHRTQSDCKFAIDYKAGGTNEVVAKIDFDKKLLKPEKSYAGESLTITAPHKNSLGTLTVAGEDARALFFTMQASAQSLGGSDTHLPGLSKRGQEIICLQRALRDSPESLVYTCSLYFNYRLGTVLSAEAFAN